MPDTAGDKQSQTEKLVSSIDEARARRAKRGSRARPKISPSDPQQTETAQPDDARGRRRGRSMAATIAEPTSDADAILERLARTEHGGGVPTETPPRSASADAPELEIDEILALLDRSQGVPQNTVGPAVPRGTADLQPRTASRRRSRSPSPATTMSGPRSGRGRRPSFALLLGGCLVATVIVAVLGFSLAQNSTTHPARSSAADESVSSPSRTAEVPLVNFVALSSQLANQVHQAAEAVEQKAKAAARAKSEKRRAAKEKAARAKKAKHASSSAHATGTSSSEVAPASEKPAPSDANPPAESSGAASSGTSSSASSSSSQISVSSLGGVVGSPCNPVCK